MDSDLPDWVREGGARRTAEMKAIRRERIQREVQQAANAAVDAGQNSVAINTATYATTQAEKYPDQILADQQAAQEAASDLHLPPGYKAEVRVVDDTVVSTTIFGSQLSRTGTTSRPGRTVQIHVERTDKK